MLFSTHNYVCKSFLVHYNFNNVKIHDILKKKLQLTKLLTGILVDDNMYQIQLTDNFKTANRYVLS